jgi:hypothetical protein
MRSYTKLGVLLGTRPLDEFYGAKRFHELRVRCPFCGGEQAHKKFVPWLAPYTVITCVHCFSYFKIPQWRAFPAESSRLALARFRLNYHFDAFLLRFEWVKTYHRLKRRALIWMRGRPSSDTPEN